MDLQEIRRRFTIKGTTSGAGDTENICTVDFATLGDNSGNVSTLAVDCTAHVVLTDSAGRLRTTRFYPLSYLKVGSVVTLDVSGSPSYTITMPSGLVWTFDFSNITTTVLTARFTSPGGAAGVTCVATGWLEFDIHY